MSIKLIKKATSSPFQLQRSIVPQEEGAYQRGGYNPYALYNNDAANEAIESFSKTIGDAISTMDFSKKKKEEAPTAKSKSGSAPNKPEKIIDINELSNTGNYSNYSEQAMAPEKLRKQEAKDREHASFETARDKYESGMAKFKKEQKKKNMFSNFYF